MMFADNACLSVADTSGRQVKRMIPQTYADQVQPVVVGCANRSDVGGEQGLGVDTSGLGQVKRR